MGSGELTFEDISVGDEFRLSLSDNSWSNEDELENGEQSILQIGISVSDHPETEIESVPLLALPAVKEAYLNPLNSADPSLSRQCCMY